MSSKTLPAVAAITLFSSLLALGCGGTTPAAAGPDERPTAFSGVGAADTVDLMAWDPISRASLKRLMGEGLVAFRYEATDRGVELQLLSDCIGPSKYRFDAYSANESKVAKDAQELSAALPLGSAALSGKVGQGRTLRTDFMLVGSYGLKVRDGVIRRSALRGAGCEKATHVAGTVFVGGFAMAAGSTEELAAGVSVFGLGASGASSSSRETLANEGDAGKCAEAQKKGQKEKLCSVPLRIALIALDGVTPPSATTEAAKAGPLTCDAAMVKLEPGKLMMGSTKETNERPVHEEQVGAFCFDKTEVTAAAYGACVEAGKCTAPLAQNDDCTYRASGKENHPVNCLSLTEAESYCKAQGKRLPSEIEWEYAARGPEGRTFPWGEEEDTSRACVDHSKEGTCPVGSYPAGATKDGIVDLSGGVAEWTSSAYSSSGYGATPQDYNNVARGGSYRTHKLTDARGAARKGQSNKPDRGAREVGVRCAK